MAKRPKDMLPQNRRSAVSGQKKMSFELSIDEKHGEPGVQYRQRREDDESIDKVDPGKQRETTHRHAGPAKAKNGCDDVNGKANRPGAEDEDRDRPVVNALPARIGRLAQRRVSKPADCRCTTGEHAKVQQDSAERYAPEAKRVEPRKRHIARADL